MHEEVLRLLMVATDRLGVPKLAEYLQSTLANSKKSRRCVCPLSTPASPHLDCNDLQLGRRRHWPARNLPAQKYLLPTPARLGKHSEMHIGMCGWPEPVTAQASISPTSPTRRTKRRHAEAEGLEETVAMAGYETAYGGYFSEGPSGFYTAGAPAVLISSLAGVQQPPAPHPAHLNP